MVPRLVLPTRSCSSTGVRILERRRQPSTGFAPKIVRTNPATIAVTYTYAHGTDSNADPTGRTHASYSWNPSTGKVDMTGNTPPDQ